MSRKGGDYRVGRRLRATWRQLASILERSRSARQEQPVGPVLQRRSAVGRRPA